MLKALSLVVLATLVTPVVNAQTAAYPTKPIRLIVPFAPGGAADQTARLISDPMSKGASATDNPCVVFDGFACVCNQRKQLLVVRVV